MHACGSRTTFNLVNQAHAKELASGRDTINDPESTILVYEAAHGSVRSVRCCPLDAGVGAGRGHDLPRFLISLFLRSAPFAAPRAHLDDIVV